MSKITDKTARTVTVTQGAINGYYLTVADVLAFADALREAKAPDHEMLAVVRAFDTLHETGLRVTWYPDS